MPSSRGPFDPGIKPLPRKLAGRFFTTSTTWEALKLKYLLVNNAPKGRSKRQKDSRWICKLRVNRHYSVVEEGSSWRGEVRESFVGEKELCLTWKDKLKSDWRTEDSFQQGKVTSCQPCLEKEESVARPHMGWRNGEASTVGCSAVDCSVTGRVCWLLKHRLQQAYEASVQIKSREKPL